MYECFDNLIGIDKCSKSTPISGLWLNGAKGLPSIDLATVSSVVDSETHTGINLMQGALYRAIAETISDAKAYLSEIYQYNNVANIITYNGSNYTYTGVNYIEHETLDELIDLSIESIYLTSNASNTYSVIINEDGVVRTQNITTIANNKGFYTINAKANSYLRITIDYGTDIITAGKRFVNYSLQETCSDDAFWCNFKKELSMAIQYKAGYNIMHEIASTNRFNGGFSKEIAVANMNLWYGTYNVNNGKFEGGEYQKYLQSAINSIKNGLKSINSCCLTCTQSKMVYVTP